MAAATQILLEHQNDVLKPGMTDDEKKAADDNFNHRLADVNRCWIKYALNLMSDSRERLLSDAEDAGKYRVILLTTVYSDSRKNHVYSLLYFVIFQILQS